MISPIIVKKKNSFYEKHVFLSDKGKLNFLHKKISKKLIKYVKILKLTSSNNSIEYPIKAIDYLTTIAKKIKKFNGSLLTFDYGYILNSRQETLQSVKKHRFTNMFSKPGSADITSHVNFALFKKILEKNNLDVQKIKTQSEFLQKMGIVERAHILSRNMTFKSKANMYFRLKKLLNSREMGSLFKVLFAQKKGKKFSLGF